MLCEAYAYTRIALLIQGWMLPSVNLPNNLVFLRPLQHIFTVFIHIKASPALLLQ